MASDEVMKEFVANNGERPAKPKVTRTQMKRGKRIKPVSEDQEKLKKRWALIKQSMIEAQVKTNGWTECMECGTQNPRPIDLDHIIPTGKGGLWFPSNAQLLCRVCHEAKHRNLPEWTKGEKEFDEFWSNDGSPHPDDKHPRYVPSETE